MSLRTRTGSRWPPAVLVNEESGTRAPTLYSLDYGYRRIAFVGGQTWLGTGRERECRLERAPKERGVDPTQKSCWGQPSQSLRGAP
jgi:DNA-binding LacI/PurR family transcriptional regulator